VATTAISFPPMFAVASLMLLILPVSEATRERLALPGMLDMRTGHRSNLIGMGADGTIGREDLRAKLTEADEERDSCAARFGRLPCTGRS
jgi:hypothetical protein